MPTFRFLALAAMLLVSGSLLAGCGVNNIPSYEEQAKAGWSEVLNQYKRRADLVPNLVKTVKAFAAHEKEVLTSVVEARAKATQINANLPKDILSNPAAFEQFQKAQGALGSALGRLLAVVERYPDLKSSQNFLDLQTQLEGTENRIAVARGRYIDKVRIYNTELKTYPGVWWKALLYPEYEPMQRFSVTPAETKTPQVDFN